MQNNRLGLRGIDHFSIPVSDPERALSFYEEILGAQIFVDEIGTYWFGRSEEDQKLGRSQHIFLQIGATRVELLGEDPGGEQPFGTHHAFGVGPNDFDAVIDHLKAHGVPFWGPGTHRGTQAASVYVKDPDGNQLEFVCWDGYPRLAEVPLSQHMAKPSISYEWDAVNRKAIPIRSNPADGTAVHA